MKLMEYFGNKYLFQQDMFSPELDNQCIPLAGGFAVWLTNT